MTNYYATSADYHNDLDRFEAQRRAEYAERELNEAEKPQCCCYEYPGDNLSCPVHFPMTEEEEGSDSSMAAQLNDAGFGSDGVM